MDIISHGLWGGISFGRKNRRSFWLAFILGILPDFLSFGIFSISTFIGINEAPDWKNGPLFESSIPHYIHALYDVTHSLAIFVIIFIFLWIIFKRPIWEFLAWGLHILMDIGVHSTSFFPTPFLWPFPHPMIDGIPWAHPIIIIPNIIFLAGLYIWYFVIRPRVRAKRH